MGLEGAAVSTFSQVSPPSSSPSDHSPDDRLPILNFHHHSTDGNRRERCDEWRASSAGDGGDEGIWARRKGDRVSNLILISCAKLGDKNRKGKKKKAIDDG
jgi:hypothetical protein